jgi:hypothetical protein
MVGYTRDKFALKARTARSVDFKDLGEDIAFQGQRIATAENRAFVIEQTAARNAFPARSLGTVTHQQLASGLRTQPLLELLM